MPTPNTNYRYGDFVGLSWEKVNKIMEDQGWMENGRLRLIPYHPLVWDNLYQDYLPSSDVVLQPELSSVIYGPDPETIAAYTDLDTLLPPNMEGVQWTDGSNMLVLGRYLNSDKIEFSQSWYNTIDTGTGQMLGEKLVLSIIGGFGGPLAAVLIAAGKAATTPDAPPTRPVNLSPPEEVRDDLAPIDEPPPEIIPTPTTIPGGSVDEPLPESAESAKLTLWPLALVALALFS